MKYLSVVAPAAMIIGGLIFGGFLLLRPPVWIIGYAMVAAVMLVYGGAWLLTSIEDYKKRDKR